MSNITLKIKKLASKGYILAFGGILLFGGGATALYLGGFGTSSSVDLDSGLVGHWKMDKDSSEWFEGFESGNLDDWTIHDTDFEVKTDNVHEGTYSAGITTSTAPEDVAEIIPEDFSGGRKSDTFSFYWYETTSSSGGGLRLLDDAGNLVAGFASDNDQWVLNDGDGWIEVKGSTSTYQVWNYVEFDFNWGAGTYDYYIERLSDGETRSGTRNLASSSGIETLKASEHHNQIWGGHGAMHMWFDNIKFTSPIARDSTPHVNHGLVEGATPTQDRQGNADSAYEFNGSTDLVEINPVDNFPSTAITTSFWVKTTDSTDGTVSYASNGHTNDWLLFNSGSLSVYRGSNGSIGTGVSFNDGNWHHIAVSWRSSDGQTIVYKDGLEVFNGTHASGTSITNDGCLVFAQEQDAICGGYQEGQAFGGSLDDIRIYDRVLSSEEVSALHDSQDKGSVQVSDLQKNLKGHWKMDGNAKDSTPFRNHGTVNGAVFATDRKGQAEGALEANSIDNNVEVPHNSSLNFGNGSFSITGYVYVEDRTIDSRTGQNFIFYKRTGNAGNADQTGYYLRAQDSGSLVLVRQESSTSNTVGASGAVPLETWTHVAGVADKETGQLLLYADGNLVGTETFDTTVNVDNITTGLINRARHDNHSGVGKYDDVRVYDRALSEDEIKDMNNAYNPTFQMSDLQKGMVGDWALDGHSKDSTPYRNHGTLGGSPTPTTDRKGRTDSAYDFDGSNDYINAGDVDGDFNPMTLSLWFNAADASSSGQRIAIKEQSGSQGWALSLGDPGANRLRFYTRELSAVSLDTNSIISANTWYHAVAVWDSSNGVKQIWVDGEKVAETSGITGSQADTNASFGIGARPDSTGHFNGKIDGVRLYDRVLSGEEIKALYGTYR